MGAWPVEVRAEFRPRCPLRLPRSGLDGLARKRNGVLERLLHIGDEPAVVRVAQPAEDRIVIGARAHSRDVAAAAIDRMRFACGVDDDLGDFVRRFWNDPLIGASVRRHPYMRVGRRPMPFEALAGAVTEQLIELDRATDIQRRMIFRWGRRAPSWSGDAELRDFPSAEAVARLAPAELRALDLSASRSTTMIRAAGEVASGRVDLLAPDHERGWRRLRAIPGVGPWTVEILALHGQGRYDQIPAGDLSFIKFAGRLLSGGDRRARATEDEVREIFAPYEGWAGLAGAHALRSAGMNPGAAQRAAA